MDINTVIWTSGIPLCWLCVRIDCHCGSLRWESSVPHHCGIHADVAPNHITSVPECSLWPLISSYLLHQKPLMKTGRSRATGVGTETAISLTAKDFFDQKMMGNGLQYANNITTLIGIGYLYIRPCLSANVEISSFRVNSDSSLVGDEWASEFTVAFVCYINIKRNLPVWDSVSSHCKI